MRSTKELLEIMLNNKHLFKTGMCFWADSLYAEDLITEKESNILYDYIKSNPPDYFSLTNFTRNHTPSAYFFPFGEIKPRIYWIKRHIKRLK